MRETEIIDYATRLLDAHGDKAELEAAQKVQDFEARNDAVEADKWRRIRAAIHQRRRAPGL